MTIPAVRLRAPRRDGHPWVFEPAVAAVEGAPAAGAAVTVARPDGRPAGWGWWTPGSKARVRLVETGVAAPFDEAGVLAVLRRRFDAAVGLRAALGRDRAGRLAFGESDGLPGLIVDRYADTVVVQLLTAGTEVRRAALVALVREVLGEVAVVERSDSGSREREGLPPARGVLAGVMPPDGLAPFEAGGLAWLADVAAGQKTGFYLDQVDAWTALRPLARGRRILDACCYTGAFGLSLLSAGGRGLVGVDSSARAIGLARRHAELNGLADRAEFRQADVAEALADLARAGERFGFVILDPSAFAKARAHAGLALKAYARLNELALAVLEPGGFLFTCSCTPRVGRTELVELADGAAHRAGRSLTPLEFRGASRDHPVHPAMPDTAYLAGLLCYGER